MLTPDCKLHRGLAPALVLIAFCVGCSGRSEEPAEQPAPAATQPGSAAVAAAGPIRTRTRSEPFPIRVVEMSGDPSAVGDAHGRALGGEIRGLHQRYLGQYFQNDFQRSLALGAARAFEPYLVPEHLAEIKALAAGSGVDEGQMLLAQCFLDVTPMTACSTVTLPADAAPDGVARFGRNLDFPSFDIADRFTRVLVFRPAGRNAFVSVGWPGMAGVLSGMNEHGLAIANMEVSRGLRMPAAMPYTLLYRSVLERCATTAEAVEFLKKTPRQSANNLMVMDAAGDRAVIEITPERVSVRRGAAGRALFSTNHQRGDDCDTAGRCGRYDCMHDRAVESFGRIDVARLQSMLHEVSQGDLTLQSMIFEPSERVLYLSAGKDAAAGTLHRLDLKRYFGEMK